MRRVLVAACSLVATESPGTSGARADDGATPRAERPEGPPAADPRHRARPSCRRPIRTRTASSSTASTRSATRCSGASRSSPTASAIDRTARPRRAVDRTEPVRQPLAPPHAAPPDPRHARARRPARLLTGVVVGDIARDTRADATPRDDYNGFSNVQPRWLYAQYRLPFGIVRIGQQPNHWGMGILANDGDHPTLFGDYRYGSISERILFATKPGGKDSDFYRRARRRPRLPRQQRAPHARRAGVPGRARGVLRARPQQARRLQHAPPPGERQDERLADSSATPTSSTRSPIDVHGTHRGAGPGRATRSSSARPRPRTSSARRTSSAPPTQALDGSKTAGPRVRRRRDRSASSTAAWRPASGRTSATARRARATSAQLPRHAVRAGRAVRRPRRAGRDRLRVGRRRSVRRHAAPLRLRSEPPRRPPPLRRGAALPDGALGDRRDRSAPHERDAPHAGRRSPALERRRLRRAVRQPDRSSTARATGSTSRRGMVIAQATSDVVDPYRLATAGSYVNYRGGDREEEGPRRRARRRRRGALPARLRPQGASSARRRASSSLAARSRTPTASA